MMIPDSYEKWEEKIKKNSQGEGDERRFKKGWGRGKFR